jgi:hypothetical protein
MICRPEDIETNSRDGTIHVIELQISSQDLQVKIGQDLKSRPLGSNIFCVLRRLKQQNSLTFAPEKDYRHW